jgi:predicted lipoprotein with Yx(FWY)xxD motif
MHTKSLIGLLAIAAVGVAACGSSGSNDASNAPGPAAATATAPAPASPGSTVAVKVADKAGAKILVGADGKTLYGFTNDIDAKSTCYSACAEAWPPVIVDAQWTVGPGLDTGVFSTVTRDDGTLQLAAGKWPLYEYSGDATSGDTNGQGSGDVWFIVGSDAKLVKGGAGTATGPTTTPAYGQSATPGTTAPATTVAPAAATITVAKTSLGNVLADAQGRTLYAFTKDVDGTPTCTDACAKAWPPATVSGDASAAPGITAAVTVIDAPGGGKMMKVGKWPVYRFAGDAAPGDTNGQGSGGSWFVIGADGKLVKS